MNARRRGADPRSGLLDLKRSLKQDPPPEPEDVDFEGLMRGVTKLSTVNKTVPEKAKPEPLPRPKTEPAASAPARPSPLAPFDPMADYRAAQPLKSQNRAALKAGPRPMAEFEPRPVAAASEFAAAVGPTQPIDRNNRVWQEKPKPSPVALQLQQDEARVLRDALSDDYPWVDEDDNGDELLFLRPGLSRDILRRLRRGNWVVQAEIDFHGCTVEEARERFGQFMRHCLEHGHRCLRLVHGKGLSSKNKEPVIKPKLRGWLIQREEVLAFCPARPFDGGNGAVIVLLRGSRERTPPPAS